MAWLSEKENHSGQLDRGVDRRQRRRRGRAEAKKTMAERRERCAVNAVGDGGGGGDARWNAGRGAGVHGELWWWWVAG